MSIILKTYILWKSTEHIVCNIGAFSKNNVNSHTTDANIINLAANLLSNISDYHFFRRHAFTARNFQMMDKGYLSRTLYNIDEYDVLLYEVRHQDDWRPKIAKLWRHADGHGIPTQDRLQQPIIQQQDIRLVMTTGHITDDLLWYNKH